MRDGGVEYALTPEQQARRHLLKLATYVPPAILGAMIAGSRLAGAQTVSCGGTTIVVSAYGHACCPCVTPGPDSVACRTQRCLLGNCSACQTLQFATQAACRSAVAKCGTCRQAPPGHGLLAAPVGAFTQMKGQAAHIVAD